MQIISQFAPLPLAEPEKGTAVAMGFFDGIHTILQFRKHTAA